jgi:hypothetical protein
MLHRQQRERKLDVFFFAKKAQDVRWAVVWAVGILVGIASLAGTPFSAKGGLAVSKGGQSPLFP